ncbi:MAG: MgtC/SapB family protein [Anaerolineales bacterium]|nr:MgtC/SapB family protein [Anaerolineales bacterium]MCB0032199.1 MgtC/SapB family protein [Anaerolineales bacterium]
MMIELKVLAYIALALVLGGLIGLERELADKPAGLRTHMLVAGAATFLTSIGEILVANLDVAQTLIRSDPIRIIEAIITGISFLGAGTIIRHRSENEVEGLTTAASLLFAAAIGIGIAEEQFILAGGSVLLILLTLRVLKYVQNRWLA